MTIEQRPRRPRHGDQLPHILIGHGTNFWDFLDFRDGLERMNVLSKVDDGLDQRRADAGKGV
ncbi:MAG: hypothetical protein QF925_05305 [Dehalococcoidia bacterium]|nr:hypothetical protein [Dehalococcoidia bacterium]